MHNEPDFTQRIRRMAQGDEDPVLQRHINECPDCQEELETLKHLVKYQEVTGGRLAELPENQTANLMSLFKRIRPDLGAATPAAPTLIERAKTIWAELLHDTGGEFQLAGLRGGESGNTRQIAFISDAADLDLEVTKKGDQQSIVGQLGMDELPSHLSIQFIPADKDPLENSDESTISSEVDDEGYFTTQVPAGSWVVKLRLDDAVVLFPEVKL